MNAQLISKTFDLLEDLAKNGAIKVTINKPPKKQPDSRLTGLFALVPNISINGRSNVADRVWRVVDKHGGHYCGNGLGKTKDNQYYWVQSQIKENFYTGEFIWEGKDTNEYRKWYCEELANKLLGV